MYKPDAQLTGHYALWHQASGDTTLAGGVAFWPERLGVGVWCGPIVASTTYPAMPFLLESWLNAFPSCPLHLPWLQTGATSTPRAGRAQSPRQRTTGIHTSQHACEVRRRLAGFLVGACWLSPPAVMCAAVFRAVELVYMSSCCPTQVLEESLLPFSIVFLGKADSHWDNVVRHRRSPLASIQSMLSVAWACVSIRQ
jgi:hypothetical protein